MDGIDIDSDKKSDKKECQNCHQLNAPINKFCNFCGLKLIPPTTCPNCNRNNNSSYRYCMYCGADLPAKLQSPIAPNENISNQMYANYHNPDFYVDQIYWHQGVPKWWKMPVFFIAFTISGITLFMTFALTLIVGLTNVISLTSESDAIYLEVIFYLAQIALILFCIGRFKGFRFFRNETIESDVPIPKKKFKIIHILLFLILLIFALQVLDVILFFVLNFIKELLGVTNPAVSPYTDLFQTFDEGTIGILFILIITVLGPIREEILFRYFLQKSLYRSGTSDFTHYIVQALTFSYLHLLGDILGNASLDFIILHMIDTAVFAIFATWLVKKFGNLLYPILLHIAVNSVSVFLFYLPSFITITEENYELIDIALISIFILILLLSIVILMIFFGWRIKKPLAFKTRKSKKTDEFFSFSIKVLIVFVFFDLLQWGFVIVPLTIIQSTLYIIVISVITLIIIFLWGSKVIDVTLKKLKQGPEEQI